MKKLLAFSLSDFVFSMLFFSCSDGANGDDFVDKNYSPKGTFISTSNLVNGFFDLADADNSFVSFDLDSKGEPISTAEVSVSYKDSGDILLTSISTFPSTVNVAMSDVLSTLNITAEAIEIGDVVTFTFDAIGSGASYRSGNTLIVPFSCKSSIGGTYDYLSTNLQAANGYDCPTGEVAGTITFEELGGGDYVVSDLGFGQYESSCWNDGPATSANAKISDVCNRIISGGLDQFGLTYTWTVTDVSGGDLSISWGNDYGDSGDVVISRTDGTDWPALFTN
jgi:hypothetical protein